MELMPFMTKVKAHLEEVAKKDKQFAESLKKENKSWTKCEKYILQEVQKQAKGSRAVGCDDDDIYNLAIHYFDEDDITVGGAKPNVKVTHTEEKLDDFKKRTEKKRASKKSKKVEEDNTDEYEPLSLEIPLF
jgi:hypothetical protein